MWNFFFVPHFWILLVVGLVALWPRVTYLAERERMPGDDLQPTLAQRLVLIVPGLCAFIAVIWLQSIPAGVALVVAYVLSFAVMIVVMRGRS